MKSTATSGKSPSRSRRATFVEQKKLQKQQQQQQQHQQQQQLQLPAQVQPTQSDEFLDFVTSAKDKVNSIFPLAKDLGLSSSSKNTQSTKEAEQILLLALAGASLPSHLVGKVQRAAPFFPLAGTTYLFAADSSSFDDGYSWKEILHKPDLRTDKGTIINYRLSYVSTPQVSSKFQRETYELDGLVLASYSGDESFAQRSRNSANHSSTSSKIAKSVASSTAVINSSSMAPAVAVTSSLLYSSNTPASIDSSGQLLHAQEPQSLHQQAIYVPALRPRSALLQATPMMETTSAQNWYQDLARISEELANGKVVKNLTIFPSMQMTLIHPDMTKEFEHCCRMLCADLNEVTDHSNNGIKLFYDTTLSFGRIYGTVLSFVNACYEGNPVMPLAVNLHEAKFKSSHQIFWARIVGDLPALQKYRFPLIIDDAEPAVHLAVKTQAPNLVQLESWPHRFRDIDRYLRSKGYGEEAIRYYKACIDYLLHSESKQSMHDRFRKEFESVWPKDFVFYYRQKLLPRSGRLGQWAMLKLKINDDRFLCPHSNPEEEFHLNCKSFLGWDHLSVDQLVRAFYFLFLYYVSETSNDGVFKMKKQYKPSHNRRSSLSNLVRGGAKNNIPHPSQICDFIMRNFPKGMAPAASAAATQRWMAYGATEVQYAKAPSGLEPRMENVCDIQTTLENLIQRNHLSEVDLDSLSLSELNLTPLGLGNDHSGRHVFVDHLNGGRSHELPGTNAQFMAHVAPPSPAPNGRVPSPAPLTRSAEGALYHIPNTHHSGPPQPPMSLQSGSEQYHHPFIVTSSAASATVMDPPLGSATVSSLTLPGASNAPPPSSLMKQTNFPPGLTTIPESGETRPQSRLSWSYDAEGPSSSALTSDLRNLVQGQDSMEDRGFPMSAGFEDTMRNEIQRQGSHELAPAEAQAVAGNKAMLKERSISGEDPNKPLTPSLMLWRKVQHCVVFGGSFITSSKERENRMQKRHN